jgi:hypothetical protein
MDPDPISIFSNQSDKGISISTHSTRKKEFIHYGNSKRRVDILEVDL